MEIRTGEAKDIEILVQFNTMCALESEGKVLNPESAYKGTMTLIENASKGIYYIAEIEGQAVGCLMVNLQWEDSKANYIYWLQSVFTKPEFRRRGVFKSLFRHAYKQAEAKGLGLRSYVDVGNHASLEAHRMIGMKEASYAYLSLNLFQGS
jgi:GNAT superfamily N-acetyltransferase